MGNFIDLTGKEFGRLTVVSRADNINKKTRWSCICSCSNLVIVQGSNIKSGKIKSCGCIRQEQARINGATVTTHGMTNTPLYSVWDGIKKRSSINRCKPKSFNDYIGRGILLCAEWDDSFLNFYLWSMKNGYAKGLQIDRIDNDKGYSPGNCRFVTPIYK